MTLERLLYTLSTGRLNRNTHVLYTYGQLKLVVRDETRDELKALKCGASGHDPAANRAEARSTS